MKFAALLFAAVLFVTSAFAIVPTTMTYQAIFTDLEGNVMPDGVYEIGFHIFSSPVGGPPVWSEWQDVTVTDGVFEVILGTWNPLAPSDFLDPEGDGVWMSLSYNDTWMNPRQFISSVPFAFIACWADSARKAMLADSATNLGVHTSQSVTDFQNLTDARLDSHALCLDSVKSDIDSLFELVANLQAGNALVAESFNQSDFNNIDVPLAGVNISVESFDIVVDSDGSTIAFSAVCGGTVNANFPELCCGEMTMVLSLIDAETEQNVFTCGSSIVALPGAPHAFCFASNIDAGTYFIRATLATSIQPGGNISFVRLAGITYSGLVLQTVAP